MSGEQMASCVAGWWGGGSVTKTSASNDDDNQLPVNLACWQEMASKICRVLCFNQSTQGGKQIFLGGAEHEMNVPGCAGLLWTRPQVKKREERTPFNCFIVSLFLCVFFLFVCFRTKGLMNLSQKVKNVWNVFTTIPDVVIATNTNHWCKKRKLNILSSYSNWPFLVLLVRELLRCCTALRHVSTVTAVFLRTRPVMCP